MTEHEPERNDGETDDRRGDWRHVCGQVGGGRPLSARAVSNRAIAQAHEGDRRQADFFRVETTNALLEKGATPKGRKELAEATGIGGKLILGWVNMVDLFRIKGVGEEYADLLERAGVDTVPELAQRNGDNLHAKMVEVNEEKKLVRQVATVDQVKGWIEEAKGLPRVVEY